MEKDNAKAQITIPAAQNGQEASWRTPQHYEQPQLVAADGAQIDWSDETPNAAHKEIPIYLKALVERGTAITVAKELFQEAEHRREQNRLSKAKYREEHREEYNAKMREVMRKRATKTKEQNSPSTPPKNTRRY